MKNWKTTLGGILSAAGLSMQASENGTVKVIGFVVAGLGTLLMGYAAQDK